jgi:hypothetical protein
MPDSPSGPYLVLVLALSVVVSTLSGGRRRKGDFLLNHLMSNAAPNEGTRKRCSSAKPGG